MDLILESNGLGGYCCGTICGLRQWPSHGSVVVAKNPPIDRYVLVNGFNVTATVGTETFELTTNRFRGGKLSPDARDRIIGFESKPWPVWTFDLGPDHRLQFECVVRHGHNQFVFTWQHAVGDSPIKLTVEPLLSGRPMNANRTEKSKLELDPKQIGSHQFQWNLPMGSPPLNMLCDGEFTFSPQWIPGFFYDDLGSEELACPGVFTWELLPRDRAHIIAHSEDELPESIAQGHRGIFTLADRIRKAERTRRKLFRSPLDQAAGQYIVQSGEGKSILSGYPRGTEKGSHAMIAVRGICLSPGRLEVASDILETWRKRLAAGLLPSEISEHRLSASFESPEPSLWYVVAVYEYIHAALRQGRVLTATQRESFERSIHEILQSLSDRHHKKVY
ncbi:MAG: glycogen debranching enzyme N-terminal domain-containing protein, partial [Verrucomicrobiota bacterium]